MKYVLINIKLAKFNVISQGNTLMYVPRYSVTRGLQGDLKAE